MCCYINGCVGDSFVMCDVYSFICYLNKKIDIGGPYYIRIFSFVVLWSNLVWGLVPLFWLGIIREVWFCCAKKLFQGAWCLNTFFQGNVSGDWAWPRLCKIYVEVDCRFVAARSCSFLVLFGKALLLYLFF